MRCRTTKSLHLPAKYARVMRSINAKTLFAYKPPRQRRFFLCLRGFFRVTPSLAWVDRKDAARERSRRCDLLLKSSRKRIPRKRIDHLTVAHCQTVKQLHSA